MSEANDPIERLFQERLRSEGGSGNWDLPSGDVWRKIEAAVTGSRRRRRGAWMLFFGGVLAALIGYGIFGYNGNTPAQQTPDAQEAPDAQTTTNNANDPFTPHADEEVTAPRTTPAAGESEPGVAGQASVASASVSPGEAAGEADRMHKETKAETADTRDQAPPTPPQKTPPVVADVSQKAIQTGRPVQEDMTRRQTGHGKPVASEQGETERRQLLTDPARLTQISSFVATAGIRPDQATTADIARYRAVNRWALGAYVAPAFGTRAIRVPSDRPALRKALLQQEEESLLRLDFGLSAEYRASHRWAFGIGAEYADFRQRSIYTRQVRYTRSGETVNDRGNLENKYKVNIQTSYGRVSTDIVVERDQGAPLPEHTFITFEMPVRQSLQMLRVPVYAQYRLTNGRVPVYVRGGLTLNYLLESSLDVQGIVSLDSAVDRIRTLHDGSIEGAKKMTFGYQAAIGTDIPVGRGWAVSVEAATSAATEPLYRNDELRVFPVSTELRLGMSYSLK